MRARAFEELRVHARPASIRRRILAAATVLRIPKRLARAPARHRSSSIAAAFSHHLQLRRALAVQLRRAPRARAVPGAALRHHQHGQIVAVHEAHVVEVKPVGAVQRELRQSGRRHRSGAGALDGAGSAVPGDAGESTTGGVLRTECPSPHSARPRGGDGDGNRVARVESEPRRGKRRSAGA